MLSISAPTSNVAFSSTRPKSTSQPTFGTTNWRTARYSNASADTTSWWQKPKTYIIATGTALLLTGAESAFDLAGRAIGWENDGWLKEMLFKPANKTLGNVADADPEPNTSTAVVAKDTATATFAPPPPVVIDKPIVDANGTNTESDKVAIGDAYTEAVVIRNGEEVTAAEGGLTATNYAAFYKGHLTAGEDKSFFNGFAERGLTRDEVVEALKMVHGSGISDWRYDNAIKTTDDGTQYVDIEFLTEELPRSKRRKVSSTAPATTYRATNAGTTGAITIEDFDNGDFSVSLNYSALRPKDKEIGLTVDEVAKAIIEHENIATNLQGLSRNPGNSELLTDEEGKPRALQKPDFRAAADPAQSDFDKRIQQRRARLRAAEVLGKTGDRAKPDAK